MKDGFVRVEAVTPPLRVADCEYNAQEIIRCMREAAARGSRLAVFPELSITGYTCGDLFLQQSLQRGALRALRRIAAASGGLSLVAVVGLPLAVDGKLYNCAAVVAGGRVLGFVPKSYLPNYGEFYEKRWFEPAPHAPVRMLPQEAVFRAADEAAAATGEEPTSSAIPFGRDLLFSCRHLPDFTFAVEICEDLWAPLPPSTMHALAGATVLVNLSASDETVGKREYRRELVCGQSARTLSAYLYADAGSGESSTDMTFSGNDLIAVNGALLSETPPFAGGICAAVIDVGQLSQERIRNSTFVPLPPAQKSDYVTVPFDLPLTETALPAGMFSRTPFIPADDRQRAERCELILGIQAEGLAKRMRHAQSKAAVIGISGGLDSCLTLLAAVRAMARQARPAADVHALTMPCFGTSRRTRENAQILCEELGVTFEEIPIGETVRQHFRDIGQDGTKTDVTFENAQARVRTLTLMDRANQLSGLVVGTGDLSELALGWATYNGDHMSMYGVNAGIPKTLVRHIVLYEAERAAAEGRDRLASCLLDILDTPVSPELLPTGASGEIAQETERIIGPYELHDFCLYYVLRFGFTPQKIYRIARTAFEGSYSPEELLYWLENFYRRFFAQQFKRSCLPDGPKVGSVTLSPRGDWRMPSDAVAALWLDEIREMRRER